ncbi:transglutaminase-like domain-containing protein [Clostridium sp.]|uniref:transglutaminase-like domain-containing protein n=1 Tax=Clostridium sp. TaxID=1506 RepID=UPI002FCC938B
MDIYIIARIIEDITNIFHETNIISIILYGVLLYPLIVGFLFKLSSEALLSTFKSLFSNIALLLSLTISTKIAKDIIINDKYNIMSYINNKLSPTLSVIIEKKPQFVMGALVIVLLLIIYQIMKLIIHVISDIALSPIFNALDSIIKKGGNTLRRIFGVIFQIPKALCYIIIITFLLNYLSMLNLSKDLNYALESSNIYNYFTEKVVIPITKSKVAQNLPNIINDSFKIYDSKNENIDFDNATTSDIIYYNGVTLAQGIRSNEEIDNLGVSIAASSNNTYGKAKKIYQWVGSEISYDNDKAVQVMNNSRNIESGAIPTFYSRKGVCFDYACLFVAMCRANDIKVRLIVGEGFNGKTWISHAWNEVYIAEENRWINVDPTFYVGGDYFDSERFKLDHKNRQVAGEW